MFYKSNRRYFVWVYRRDKSTWCVGRTLEKLVNHEQEASDYQVSVERSPNIASEFIGKPKGKAVYG